MKGKKLWGWAHHLGRQEMFSFGEGTANIVQCFEEVARSLVWRGREKLVMN